MRIAQVSPLWESVPPKLMEALRGLYHGSRKNWSA